MSRTENSPGAPNLRGVILSSVEKESALGLPRASDANSPPSAEQPVLTMSSLGKLGRFGNQLMQYAFLRICAKQRGARIECPPWPGQILFGHCDPPVSSKLPPAIEQWDDALTMFDAVPELIPYIETLTGNKSSRISLDALQYGISNVDLWGFFQLHTRLLRPHRDFIRTLFRPVPDLEAALAAAMDTLRARGKTIVGIHLRQGDFLQLPLLGFTYPVPARWWCEWLEGIWPTLEDPVLFVCSDNLRKVWPEFAKYSAVTLGDLDVRLPARMAGLEFYSDFYLLSQCDVVGISNSTFSFVSSLLNERAWKFMRPHWDFATRFTEFDPWDSEQLLYFRSKRPKIFKTFREAMEVAAATEGLAGLLKCAYIYPRERIKMKANRAGFGYKTRGFAGLLKSLFRPMTVSDR